MLEAPSIKVLDHGYVQLVDRWGSDEDIIRAARMSTDKGFQGWGPYVCEACQVAGRLDPDGLYRNYAEAQEALKYCACKGVGKVSGDEKLLKYLWTHKHYTPFEMAGAVFEVQAPIFVFRQWHRHRTQSYNELSGRYTILPDLYYVPSEERLMESAKKSKNKQATGGGELKEKAMVLQIHIEEAHQEARRKYELLKDAGVADELARIVLPVSQYSRMRASANLRNWLHFLGLRLDSHAQYEIRVFAEALGEIFEGLFPRTYQLFKADVK